MRVTKVLLYVCLTTVFGMVVLETHAADNPPCRSGLEIGQRPMPYAALVATGPLRGQSHCFICETADRPAVIIFARSLSEPLGKLVHQLDKALINYKAAELRAWVTFLSEDQTSFDPKVVQWGLKHVTGTVPLAVFEDKDGPPAYRLARDAEVTILLSTRQHVVANFAFRSGELTEDRVREVLHSLPQIAVKK